MIAVWMIYSTLVSVLLFAAAVPAEFVCRALRWPTRFVWSAALVVSVGLSASALIAVEFGKPPRAANETAIVHLSRQDNAVVRDRAVSPVGVDQQPARAQWLSTARSTFSIPGRFILWSASTKLPGATAAFSLVASVAPIVAILWLTAAFRRIKGIVRSLRADVVDGRRVLVSNDVGPAVLGVIRPTIVVPHWLLAMDEAKRRVVLAHEQEHFAAFDPALLAGAAVLLALAVWNVALWGIVSRLRQAIETDCDRRVLRDHGDARGYGELLLSVYSRGEYGMRRQLAFVNRRSSLERRIRRIMEQAPHVVSLRAGSGALVSALLIAAACETSGPARQVVEPGDGSAQRISSNVALAASSGRCLPGGSPPDFAELRRTGRARHPELFNPIRGTRNVIGFEYDENCAIRRDTVVELAAGFTFRGGNPFLAGVFGDTTGLARPRGMAFDYGNGGWIAVAYIVRPSAGWKERASSTPCGFGLRAEEACSAEGPLVFRMLDSTRVLIAIRRFNADNRPVERLFLITLARPMPALHSLTMRHAFLNSQGGAVYIEDLLATQPLLLFSVSSSNALGGLRRKRDVRIVDDVIGIAQYNAVRLTLEQIERLQPAKSCRGPRGSCYEVGGVRIEFPG